MMIEDVSSQNVSAATSPERLATAVATGLGAPIASRYVADDVVDRLVTAVALGLYVPTQQLPTERDLAAMLGVSRASIREALRRLTDTGYLEVRRGRNGGYFVRASWGPTSAGHVRRHLVAKRVEFEQIFDARNLIEPLIARTAATRRTARDLVAIHAALQAYFDAPDHDASRRADARLHLAIAEATQNPILVAVSLDLRMKISLSLGAEPYTDEARRMAIIQHTELVTAITESKHEAAAEIATRHFALSENLIRRLMDRAELEETKVEARP
jgi:GntR family transcriptional regulator, transcriptional repressor for pyruvate dehydrogenase complex